MAVPLRDTQELTMALQVEARRRTVGSRPAGRGVLRGAPRCLKTGRDKSPCKSRWWCPVHSLDFVGVLVITFIQPRLSHTM
jgi:hypothetical protein